MIRCRFLPISTLLLFLITTGCQDRVSRDAGYTVRDSAGIEIVESLAPLFGIDAWTISEEPVLQIGEVEGDDPYLFAGISGASGSTLGKVFRLEDGRIVVCNGMDSTIRFFDERGGFIRRIGGKGEGPGEFGTIWSCSPVDGGFAVLSLPSKATLFDGEGKLLRSTRLLPIENHRVSPFGVLSDGSYLVTSNASSPMGLSPGVHHGTQDVSVVTPDGRSSEFIFPMNTAMRASNGQGSVDFKFGPRGLLRANGEEIIYGWSEEYCIGVYDNRGHPVRIVRRVWDLVPVTEEDRQWKRDFYVNSNSLRGREDSPADHQARLRIAEGMAFSEYQAVFDQLLVDQTGHLWVRQQHPRWDSAYWVFNVHFPFSWTWDVFDPEGQWVTTLTAPTELEIHDIGEDYILGVWKDEMDVEYVRMYELDRGK